MHRQRITSSKRPFLVAGTRNRKQWDGAEDGQGWEGGGGAGTRGIGNVCRSDKGLICCECKCLAILEASCGACQHVRHQRTQRGRAGGGLGGRGGAQRTLPLTLLRRAIEADQIGVLHKARVDAHVGRDPPSADVDVRKRKGLFVPALRGIGLEEVAPLAGLQEAHSEPCPPRLVFGGSGVKSPAPFPGEVGILEGLVGQNDAVPTSPRASGIGVGGAPLDLPLPA